MSAEQCQGSCRNDRLKNQKDFGGIGNFYRYRLQILANLSGKHFGWNGTAIAPQLRRTQEGCGGLGAENPAAFPQARPIFQQPFSLPENAQTLAGIAFRAAGKSVKNFPAASKFAGKPFQQGISDSHSLLEFSDQPEKIRTPSLTVSQACLGS